MKLVVAVTIPLALIVAGILLMLGCEIPATGQFQPNLKPRPETSIGTGADKPIRLGYTRIDDAFIELNHQVQAQIAGGGWADLQKAAVGHPWMILFRWRVSPDKRQFAVAYDVRVRTVLCSFSAVPESESRYVVLDVNEDGIVTGAHTENAPPLAQTPFGRWQEVFDAPTRRKLHAAGVFPSDEQFDVVRNLMGWRFDSTSQKSADTRPTETQP